MNQKLINALQVFVKQYLMSVSGDYPFLRPLIDAHKFYSKKSAIGYMETFHKEKWVLQKFTCYATDCAVGNEA